jgi:teichuronic acid biosynthesis glycosyltransferase TuaC
VSACVADAERARSHASEPGEDAARLRVLTFTSLYPSTARPRHGIFVEARLDHLLRHCAVDVRVVAPVPWFPFASPLFGGYGAFARTPLHDTRLRGVPVSYPRYLMLPRLGVARQPDRMARAALRELQRLRGAGWQPQLIDSHYLYPDGVAAALLAEALRVPFVMTARGTDVNVLARMPGPGRRIADAARRAAAIVTVSRPLRDTLISCGVEASKVIVLRNGVDLDVFGLEDQRAARARLGLPAVGRLATCVGNLVPEKGQSLAIEALTHAPDLRLVIVGDGPLRAELAALARNLGVEQRVTFRPAMPQRDLRHLYASTDVLLLTSTREGWPNVVLEAMACGTPVVGVDVGAVRDMVSSAGVGRVIDSRDPIVLAGAIADVCRDPPARAAVHAHAATFDWTSVSRQQWSVFSRAVAAPAAAVH